MPLIKSISGIRGTIGGTYSDGLNPVNLAVFVSAYAHWVRKSFPKTKCKVVVGRDARLSGEMVNGIVISSLVGSGIDVIELGLATTPTVEMAVTKQKAQGGIIITASHNPREWNALKLLNHKGEFLSDEDGKRVLEMAEKSQFEFAQVDNLGKVIPWAGALDYHIETILNLDLVDRFAIEKANFKIAIDCVNSVGGISVPALLKALGVRNVIELYCEPTGEFPHNPEPLPEHLTELSDAVVQHNAHLGFVVDPDVDRLAIICEDGSMFGEEYTLVAVADYVLSQTPGNTVSNLSSTAALRDVTNKHGGEYLPSAVGEVNVVNAMKQNSAVIGGEGNGGVIYPALHYGRDALVGIALFLTHLAKSKLSCTALKATYPHYHISKNKVDIPEGTDLDLLFNRLEKHLSDLNINTVDGIRIDFDNGWVHMRKSNTEPIVRIYAEAGTEDEANEMASQAMELIKKV